jgi:hypothetical protein
VVSIRNHQYQAIKVKPEAEGPQDISLKK